MDSGLNKRGLWILCGLVSGALICIFSLFVFDDSQIESFYHQSGFYFIFITFFVWIVLLLPRRLKTGQLRSVFKEYQYVVCLIVVIVTCILLTSESQFRILADETNLLGIALAMYDSHSFYNITHGLYYYDQLHEIKHVWGIRPVFYPFLVYVTHVFAGYSAYNGFFVNAIAGVICLWCMYWLLQRLFHRTLALAGMLMLAAYPVFVLWVTSSGFEIVNLMLVLIAFCFFYQFLHTDDTYHLERVVFTLVLLSQTRYESIVFTIGFFLALLLCFKSRYLEQVSYRVLIWPFLFLPVLFQRVLKVSKGDYQVYDENAVFGFDHFLIHSRKALEYFLAVEPRYGTIAIISYLAIAGMIIGSVVLVRNRLVIAVEVKGLIVAGLISYLLLSIVVFSYYWGDLTASFTIRLGIVFLPLLITLAVFAVHALFNNNQKVAHLFLIASMMLLVFYWPVAAKNEAVEQLKLYRFYKTALGYLKANYPDKNIVIVSDRPGMYVVHQWGAVSFRYVNGNTEKFEKELKGKLYRDMLVLQAVSLEDNKVRDNTRLDNRFYMQTLFESQTEAHNKLRISRVVIE